MPALLALFGVLGLNYDRHRRGKSTICSTVRPLLTPWQVVALWLAGSAWFLPHLIRPMLRATARAAAAVVEVIDDRPTL